MIQFLIRLLISVLIACFPIIVYSIQDPYRSSTGIIVWFLPAMLILPAFFCALIVFTPIEAFLDEQKNGRWKNFWVPAAGVMLSLPLILVMGGIELLLGALSGSTGDTSVMLFLAGLGLIWGVVWRLSDLAWWSAKRVFKGKE